MSNNYDIEEMSEFFNVRSGEYDEHMRNTVAGFENYYSLLGSQIKKTDNAIKLLDLGCGTGLELEGILLNAPNAQITGIDMSQSMMDMLREKYKEHLKQIELIQDSYVKRPFEAEKYDYILSSMTMHHFLYEVKLGIYSKINKALKRGGIYIEGDYVVPKEEEQECLKEYHRLTDNLKEEEKQLYHIDIPFSLETQMKLMKEAGFASVKTVWSEGYSCIFVAEKNNTKELI